MNRLLSVSTGRPSWTWLVALLSVAGIVAGCQTTPPAPVEFTDEESVEATVVAVDAAAKTVTLRRDDGEELTIQVPEARNLAQVEAGDLLKVSYVITYGASMAEPGEAASGTALAAERAAEGEKPGAFFAAGSVSTIEIVSVSDDGSSVSFRDEYGQLDSMIVERDEGRAFARKLKKGDLVVLEYMESVALEVASPEPN
ncbi:MAG: hypothetical protein AB7I04_17445 [Pseudomonadales bacterium]